MAWLGAAGRGKARQGREGLGKARRGKAGQGKGITKKQFHNEEETG